MKKAGTILLISAFLLTFIVTKQLNVMQDTEIWKAVPGYEGYYEVSDQGRVRNLGRRKIPRIVKPYIENGYRRVALQLSGTYKHFQVNRLVLSTFEGPSNLFCDHKNTIKTDDRLVNLRWATHRQNMHFYRETQKHLTTSKYMGVSWASHRNKWTARIAVNKKQKFLGYFHSEYDAHLAYQKAFIKINEHEKNIGSSPVPT